MACELATGLPPPVITWYQDGVLVGGNRTVLPAGGLRIERVTASDAGDYECRAVNDAGAAARHVRLTVHGTYM